jgi:hypothetical protein
MPGYAGQFTIPHQAGSCQPVYTCRIVNSFLSSCQSSRPIVLCMVPLKSLNIPIHFCVPVNLLTSHPVCLLISSRVPVNLSTSYCEPDNLSTSHPVFLSISLPLILCTTCQSLNLSSCVPVNLPNSDPVYLSISQQIILSTC